MSYDTLFVIPYHPQVVVVVVVVVVVFVIRKIASTLSKSLTCQELGLELVRCKDIRVANHIFPIHTKSSHSPLISDSSQTK